MRKQWGFGYSNGWLTWKDSLLSIPAAQSGGHANLRSMTTLLSLARWYQRCPELQMLSRCVEVQSRCWFGAVLMLGSSPPSPPSHFQYRGCFINKATYCGDFSRRRHSREAWDLISPGGQTIVAALFGMCRWWRVDWHPNLLRNVAGIVCLELGTIEQQ
jgi:hypothetical protein